MSCTPVCTETERSRLHWLAEVAVSRIANADSGTTACARQIPDTVKNSGQRRRRDDTCVVFHCPRTEQLFGSLRHDHEHERIHSALFGGGTFVDSEQEQVVRSFKRHKARLWTQIELDAVWTATKQWFNTLRDPSHVDADKVGLWRQEQNIQRGSVCKFVFDTQPVLKNRTLKSIGQKITLLRKINRRS